MIVGIQYLNFGISCPNTTVLLCTQSPYNNNKHFDGWLKLSKCEIFYRGFNMSFDFSALFKWTNLTMDATSHDKQSLHFKVSLISTLNSYNKLVHTYQRTIW